METDSFVQLDVLATVSPIGSFGAIGKYG